MILLRSFHSLALTKMDSLFRGNDKKNTGMTYLLFSFLPEFEEEGHKDTYEEAKHSGD